MRRVKGTVTVEAAVIVPLILVIFVILIRVLFYSHDRIVIGAAAHETVAIGGGHVEYTAEELETYFQKRIRGRMFQFSVVGAEVEMTDKNVHIYCSATKKGMKIELERTMSRTEPENYIRNIRKLEKIKDKVGEN